MFLRGGTEIPGNSRRGLLPPFGAHFRHLVSSWRSWALSWLILALSGHILSPSCSKMVPRWPNIAQHSAKMSQHSLQELPQDPRKPCKSDELSSFFWFSLVLARSPPRSKRSRQDPSKSALTMPILSSMCAISATFWRPRWTQDAYLTSSSVSFSRRLAKKVAT